jgi:hypothetical protein
LAIAGRPATRTELHQIRESFHEFDVIGEAMLIG